MNREVRIVCPACDGSGLQTNPNDYGTHACERCMPEVPDKGPGWIMSKLWEDE